MRSSKSRSRNKNNRSRSVGNVVNRVFDSSGPEGKVRGTPQQIIDKYTQLARDATLSNDRVAAENFQQHAEHYTRLLGEAQREQDAKREAEQQQRERQQQNNANQQKNRDGGSDGGPVDVVESDDQKQPYDLQGAPQPDTPDTGDVLGVADAADADTGLVETPESKPARKARAPRKPRAPKKVESEASPSAPEPEGGPAETAAE